jgi:Putative zinc-finger
MAPETPHTQGHPAGAAPTHLPEWETLALGYLDERLSPPERALVDAHLATCAACRRDLDDQRAVRVMLSGATLAAPPAELESTVLARILATAGRLATADVELPALSPGDRGHAEHSAPTPGARRHDRRSFVSQLFRPRVWMPAAVTLVLVAVLLSQFQPTTNHLAVESPKNAAGESVGTTAAAASAPASGEAGRQADQSMVGSAATSTTMPAGATSATTAAAGGGPPVAPAIAAPEYVWVRVGSAAAPSPAASAQTAYLLARVAGAVPADPPASTAPPDPAASVYITSALRAAAPTLLADLAAAGLDPQVTSTPPTIEAAVRAIQAYGSFVEGSGGGHLPRAPQPGAVLGEAYLLLRLAD